MCGGGCCCCCWCRWCVRWLIIFIFMHSNTIRISNKQVYNLQQGNYWTNLNIWIEIELDTSVTRGRMVFFLVINTNRLHVSNHSRFLFFLFLYCFSIIADFSLYQNTVNETHVELYAKLYTIEKHQLIYREKKTFTNVNKRWTFLHQHYYS